eukprot:CAMPEP_0201988938 /NCGR_PEP_ID=MMETSP0904-20121228/92586_1 /ASSEMBLY_ACC=CAM_ASM_000553 /TAXON_ID=420261 /ORGANISM="Thalassiosira antarctica, Strain CCMP982" /LENGTH=447 /DNA_ID=CAMNT_0048543137 /DNA_START=232 /DNA_END=1574 /DNA_ORIENTATION=-
MSMYIDDLIPVTLIEIPSLSPSLATTASFTSTPSNIFCATSKLITSDPQLESEILNDVSNVALDVSTFLSPNTAWLRLCNVIGRVQLDTVLSSGTANPSLRLRGAHFQGEIGPPPMSMYIDDFIPITSIDIPSSSPSLPTAESHTSAPSNIFCATSKLITSDPQLESKILNDISNVALNVSTFLSPNTAWLRLCNVIGRVLVLSSDYVRDDHISPDEWVFHASMLAISIHMFLQSAQPLILAVCSITTLTVRDRRAYSLLFEAVGITVLQYKTLLSSTTLDWIEYAPHEVVELDGESMYFLYSGEAAIPATGNKTGNSMGVVSSIDAGDFPDGEALHVSNRILGDVQFAKTLEASLHKKAKKKSKSTKSPTTQETTNSNIAPKDSLFIVGSNGAAMLRISTSKLLQLMKNDNELSSSIQRLVLLCMQEKLSRTIQVATVNEKRQRAV